MMEIFFNIYLKFFCFFNHPINTTLKNLLQYISIYIYKYEEFLFFWWIVKFHNSTQEKGIYSEEILKISSGENGEHETIKYAKIDQRMCKDSTYVGYD